MIKQYIKNKKIPNSPGVYIFRDGKKRPLYIGRATSLKDRTKSYFSNDLIDIRGPRIVDMITKSKSLSWEGTNSVLEAIILESKLIKRYQPYYNVDERDDKSDQYVVITDEQMPRVFLVRARDYNHDIKEGKLQYKVLKVFGPYTESSLIKDVLKILRKLFPYRDIKANDIRHENFYRAIGRAPVISNNDSRNAVRIYKNTINYLILFFEGKNKKLRNKISKDMKNAAKEMRFEDAMKARRLLYALDHVNDIALIKETNNITSISKTAKQFRIEAYDIAHLSGTNVVGAMAVSINGKLAHNEYRKFKLINDKNNDVEGLKEILSRRLNHSEWVYPDLIVVDGNNVQYKTAEDVLKSRRINILVVGVTKDDKHKAKSIIGDPNIVNKYKKLILAINSEVHRFAISYHRKLRNKIY